jgi:hypothetical protein
MKDIVDILKVFGELAYWTVGPASDEQGGNLACPPIIRWRYKTPSIKVADFFRVAASTFRGTIAWEFSVEEQTWILMPARINEYSRTHGNLGGLAVAFELMTIDPDFGKRANAELRRLVEHMQHAIGEGQGRPR